MADQKISELTALTGANVADDDAIAIVDTSATETKKIVFSELKNALDTATGFVRITGDTMTGDLNVLANVGIGTSSPSANLEIAQSGNNVGLLVSGGGYNYTAKFESSDAEANIIIEDSNSTNDGNRIGVATNDMYFITDNSERMRIDSSGNVGIGTSSPQGVLDLGTASTGRALTFSKYNNIFGSYSEGSLNLTSNYYGDTTANAYKTSSTATFGAAGIEISGTGGTSTSGLIQFFVDAAASKTADAAFVPTERMRIDSSGNVGIGTSSPPYLLTVAAPAGTQAIFQAAQTGVSNGYTINSNGTSITHQWYKDAAEAMRITSAGDLLLTVTSAQDFTSTTTNGHTLYGGSVNAALHSRNDANPLALQRTGTDGSLVNFFKGTAPVGSIGSNSGYLYIGGTAGNDAFLSFGADGVRPSTSAGAARDAAIDLGGSTNRFKNLYLSGFTRYNTEVYVGDGASISGSFSANDLLLHTDNNPIVFRPNGSEAMRIDSSGNLLVGTTTTDLHTTSTETGSRVGDGLTMISRGGLGANIGAVGYFNRLSTDGDILDLRKDGSTVGSIGVQGGDAYYAGTSKGIKAVSGFIGATNTTGVLQDNNTDLGSSSYRFKDLHLSGTAYVGLSSVISAGDQGIQVDGGNGIIYIGRGSTSVSTHISFLNPNGEVGKITTTGSSTSYVTSSDYRLKENVVNLTSATTRLKQLEPKRFNFIADADTTVDGFFAHEVQSVVPEAVTGAKDAMRDEEYEVTPAVLDEDGNVVTEAVMGTRSVPDYQGIDQSKLVPLLVATIKELEARITALENA